MKLIFSEKNIVVILFILVLITFSLAQEDSREIEKIYTGVNGTTASHLLVQQPGLKIEGAVPAVHSFTPAK